MSSVCLISSKKTGEPHMIVKNEKDAKKYCKEYPQYDWECWMIMGV